MSQPSMLRPHIMVAPNGARRTKDDHPNLPISIEEIVAETVSCAAAGADALHLHVRDSKGRHSLDAGLYGETLQALDAALPGFPIQITTESAGLFGVADQLAVLQQLRPAAASISVREIARDAELAAQVYATCHENGTKVQHIVYDSNDWQQLQAWRKSDIVHPDQIDTIFVLGKYSPARDARPEDLKSLPNAATSLDEAWAVCAFGPQEHNTLLAAAAMGAKLRIGFENNIHTADGTIAKSTAANVAALRAALAAPPA